MMRIITDFDGPIMDLSARYYRAYHFCLAKIRQPKQKIRMLSQREFWDLKRCATPEIKIAQMSGLTEEQANIFYEIRQANAHRLDYMIYDRIVPGSIEALHKIKQLNIDLAVMTLRKEFELEQAFSQYKLADFFPRDRRYCLSNDHPKFHDVTAKTELMDRFIQELPPVNNTWMIGDTEADILAAQKHGIPVIGLLSGIRDRFQLEKYQPNYICHNLAEAVELLLDKVTNKPHNS